MKVKRPLEGRLSLQRSIMQVSSKSAGQMSRLERSIEELSGSLACFLQFDRASPAKAIDALTFQLICGTDHDLAKREIFCSTMRTFKR